MPEKHQIVDEVKWEQKFSCHGTKLELTFYKSDTLRITIGDQTAILDSPNITVFFKALGYIMSKRYKK